MAQRDRYNRKVQDSEGSSRPRGAHVSGARRKDIDQAASDASNLLRARKAAQQNPDGSANTSSRALRKEPQQNYGRPANASRRARNAAQRGSDRAANAGRHASHKVLEPAKAPAKMNFAELIASNAVYIVGVAAVAALAVILLVAIRSCVPTMTGDYDGELDFYYESPFDWANLDTSSERYVYIDNGKVRSYLGIDVSENQDEIDWKAVANDGIDFAMIRLGYRGATEGELFTDARFQENLAGAKKAGVKCGVYFFSQAVNAKEAQEEAEFVIKQLGGTQLEYPVAFDFEEAVPGVLVPRATGLGKDTMTEIGDAFCKRIEEAGYRSMIYGNYYDLDLYHYKALENHSIWWAEYDTPVPRPNVDIVMWQYANGGWVDGIDAAVDMNIDLSEVIG